MNKTENNIKEAVEKGYYSDKIGNIFSKYKQLKIRVDSTGYYCFSVRCGVDKKKFPIRVHRFIGYLKFGDDVFNKDKVIRHLDGDCTNNNWTNIGIGSYSDNMMDIPKEERVKRAIHASYKNRKFTNEQVKNIRLDRKNGFTYKELSEKYNTDKSRLSYLFNKALY